MPAVVPGSGRDIAAVERRVSTMERLLGGFNKIFIGVSIPGADQRMAVEVLARRGGDDEAVAGSTGPFCKVFQEDGLWKLLGGTVTGGTGNQTAADIPVGTIGSEALQDGQHYWVKADVTAVTEDGVLLPGANLTSATVGNGTSLPANDIPTAASETGHIYISLGSWSGDIFNPSGCGNIQISHCPGNLSYARG